MSDSGACFNKIWILESLQKGDLKTGETVFKSAVQNTVHKYDGLDSELLKIKDRSEFLAALDRIEREAKKGVIPILQIDCHGDKTGIYVASGEKVDWATLEKYLTRINFACNLNLLILLAACEGTYLIMVAQELQHAPFWAIVAPNQKILETHIERDFKKFYEELLINLNGDAAIAKMNEANAPKRTYYFLGIEGIFKRGYATYLKQHVIGVKQDQRIESVVADCVIAAEGKLTEAQIRDLLKELTSEAAEEQHFNRKKRAFFFIDQYPENETRFSTDFAAVKEMARLL